LVAAVIMLFSGTALADHTPADDTHESVPGDGSNEAPFWVDYLDDVRGIEGASCTKLSQSSGDAFVMPAEPAGEDWVLLVVKQATTNYIYYDPIAGHEYPSEGDNAPGHSHLIVCSVEEPEETTTTTEETTTTVEATTTTVEATTTTEEATTTTEEATTTSVEETTTSSSATSSSTSVDDTTTTSADDSTTTSAEVLETTLTTSESTTSSSDPSTTATVQGIVVTTAPSVSATDDLPFTGMAGEALVGLAVVLLGLGAALLTMTRKVDES
jgi:hypothetical protein